MTQLPNPVPKPRVQVSVTQDGEVVKKIAAYWDQGNSQWQAALDGELVYGEVGDACLKALKVLGKLPPEPGSEA